MTNNTNSLRGFAIAALLALGVITTIASGGGGGGVASDGTIVPPAGGGPTLALTAANAPTVSSTTIMTIGTTLEIGGMSGSDLPMLAVAMPPVISATKKSGDFQIELPVAEAPDISSCFNGGTVDMTITQADPNTLTVGDRIIAVFDNCDDNEGYVISGTVDLTVSSYQGDILTYIYLLGFDVTLSDLVIEDGTESVTANASFTLTLDYLDFPHSVLSLAGSQFQLSADGELINLTNFEHESATEFVAGFTMKTIAQASGTLEIQSLGGTIDYSTPVAVEAWQWEDPHVGEMLITGANSSIRILVVDTSNVTLEIDVNGDGVVDEYVYTNWSELTGDM
jgi:hypothetical protein